MLLRLERCLIYRCRYACIIILGVPTKPKDAAFGDLLGSNFNPKKSNENKPLKDLKAKNDIENALDPDRAKVRRLH